MRFSQYVLLGLSAIVLAELLGGATDSTTMTELLAQQLRLQQLTELTSAGIILKHSTSELPKY